MPEEILDRLDDVESAGDVEGAEPSPVGQVDQGGLVPQEQLPDLGLVVADGPAQVPALRVVDVHRVDVLQHEVSVSCLARLEERLIQRLGHFGLTIICLALEQGC